MTSVGCFDSSAGLSNNGSYTFQSAGYCETACADQDHAIYAMTGGNVCWCGDDAPPKSSKQSDSSDCDKTCVGYPSDICGGDGYWSVYTTGSVDEVEYYGGSSSSSSSASAASSGASSKSTGSSTTAASANQVITSIAPGKTVVITQSASSASSTSAADASDSSTSSSHHSNTAGIAAGVVVGIVVAAALAAAAFFYFRRRNRRMADDAMSKHQQIPEYSSQRPMAFGKQEGSDARLDASALAQRRMSDGSIADNEDYSRRILKVTNPDGR